MCSISLEQGRTRFCNPGEVFRVARVAFPVRVGTDPSSRVLGQMIFVLCLPLVESVLIVMVIVMFTLIAVFSVLVVALSVPFSVALSRYSPSQGIVPTRWRASISSLSWLLSCEGG